MKNRSIFSLFTVILVIFGLFAACSGASGSVSYTSGYPNPYNPSPPSQPYSKHTVKFVTNGGSPAPNQQTITYGDKVVIPPAMTKAGYIFGGWYKEASCINQWNFAADTVTGNITLYATWMLPVIVSGNTLLAKLQWLNTNATSNTAYVLEVTANESLSPQSLSYSGKNNIFIQLKGATGSPKVITLSSNGSLFSIENGVTLILGENLILQGKSNNTAPLVQVNENNNMKSGGNFTMNGGKISGNTNTSSSVRGGGVFVSSYGTFTMNGGEISGNTSSSNNVGGGVYVDGSSVYKDGRLMYTGTFTMSGGEISGNTSSNGGGVYLDFGTFTMSGGKISGNTSSSGNGGGVYVIGIFTMSGGEISSNTSSGGGGVYVRYLTFTMSGGKISGNTSSSGGGVSVYFANKDGYPYSTFTMSDGEISGNTSSYDGGGVNLYGLGATFIMGGGKISGNTTGYTTGYGGGVYGNGGTFTMSGGEISGNTSSLGGGGVWVHSNFTKSGGTITGYADDTMNGNVVKKSGVVQNNQGHAVYSAVEPVKRRETTAGPEVKMDSNLNGAAGGWEN